MAVTPYLAEQFLCGAKSEAAQNTMPTLSGGDYLYVSKGDVKIDSKNIARDYQYGKLSALADAAGQTLVNVSLECEFETSGSAGVIVPTMDALMKASGFYTSASSNDVTYKFAHTASSNFYSPGTSATVLAYYRDNLVPVKGVLGNIVLKGETNGVVSMTFEGMGLYQAFTGSSVIPTTSPKDRPITMLTSSLSVHGYSPTFTNFELDNGVTVVGVDSAIAQYGYQSTQITKREPIITFDTLMDGVGTHDFIGDMVAKTSGGLTMTLGAGSGDRLYISCSDVRYRTVDIIDKNGINYFTVVAQIVGDYTIKVF